MSRQTTIWLAGATVIGLGVLGMSLQASAAPANGANIGKAAFAEDLTQNVVWRGRAYGWHGRHAGLRYRPGLAAAGVAAAGAAATGAVATGAAAANAYNNGFGYGGLAIVYPAGEEPSYIYGYTPVPGYGYGYGAAPGYGYAAGPGYGYAAGPGYGYAAGPSYGYGYGGYRQPEGGAAVRTAAMAPAASAPTTQRSSRRGNRTARVTGAY